MLERKITNQLIEFTWLEAEKEKPDYENIVRMAVESEI